VISFQRCSLPASDYCGICDRSFWYTIFTHIKIALLLIDELLLIKQNYKHFSLYISCWKSHKILKWYLVDSTSVNQQKKIYIGKKGGKVIPLHAMEALGVRSFLTSALDGDEWSVSRPGRALPPVPIVQEAGWASRAGLDAEARGKILCLSQGSNPGRPVRSQTLYWPYTLLGSYLWHKLCYPGSSINIDKTEYFLLLFSVLPISHPSA
jgi:hypothetical protein